MDGVKQADESSISNINISTLDDSVLEDILSSSSTAVQNANQSIQKITIPQGFNFHLEKRKTESRSDDVVVEMQKSLMAEVRCYNERKLLTHLFLLFCSVPFNHKSMTFHLSIRAQGSHLLLKSRFLIA